MTNNVVHPDAGREDDFEAKVRQIADQQMSSRPCWINIMSSAYKDKSYADDTKMNRQEDSVLRDLEQHSCCGRDPAVKSFMGYRRPKKSKRSKQGNVKGRLTSFNTFLKTNLLSGNFPKKRYFIARSWQMLKGKQSELCFAIVVFLS